MPREKDIIGTLIENIRTYREEQKKKSCLIYEEGKECDNEGLKCLGEPNICKFLGYWQDMLEGKRSQSQDYFMPDTLFLEFEVCLSNFRDERNLTYPEYLSLSGRSEALVEIACKGVNGDFKEKATSYFTTRNLFPKERRVA